MLLEAQRLSCTRTQISKRTMTPPGRRAISIAVFFAFRFSHLSSPATFLVTCSGQPKLYSFFPVHLQWETVGLDRRLVVPLHPEIFSTRVQGCSLPKYASDRSIPTICLQLAATSVICMLRLSSMKQVSRGQYDPYFSISPCRDDKNGIIVFPSLQFSRQRP